MAASVGEVVGYLDLDDSKFGSALSGVFDKFKDTGGKITKAAAGLGAGAATALGAGLLGAMNVDAANDKLAAQLGLSGEDAQRLGGIAGDLYAGNFGDSIGQVDEALAGVARNMVDLSETTDTEAKNMAASVLNVAEAFDQDLGGVTRAAGQLMQTGLAKDGQEALDLITVGMQNGTNVADDLLDSLSEYPTQFRKLGLSGADAIGLMHQGILGGARDADVVADALKEFSIQSVSGTDGVAAAFKALGFNVKDVVARIGEGGPTARTAFGEVLERIKAIKDPVKQAQVATALFGTQAEDLGKALFSLDLDGAAKGLGDVEGASTQLGKTMHDNATSNLAAFGRQVQTTLVNWIGGKALPAVQHIAVSLRDGFGPALAVTADVLKNKVLPAARTVFGFLSEHQTTIKVLAGLLAGVLIPLLIAWGVRSTVAGLRSVAAWVMTQGAAVKSVLIQSAQLVVMVAKWIAAGVAATINAAKVVAGWVISGVAAAAAAVVMAAQFAIVVAGWVLMGAQSLLAAAKVAAAWLIAMGPIGLVVAAVIGLVALIVANWDAIWGATKRVWSAVSGAVSGAWRAIVGFVSSGVSKVAGFITGLPGRIVALGGQMLNSGKALMQKLFDGLVAIAKGAGSFAKGIGVAILNKVIDGLNAVVPHSLPIHINAGPIHFNKDIPLIPRIPHVALAQGAIVTRPTLATIGEGGEPEGVFPLSKARQFGFGGGGGPTVIEIRSGGSRLDDLLVEVLRSAIRGKGGNVQSVLGR